MDRNQAVLRHGDIPGKSTIRVKADDAHLFTEVFTALCAILACPAGLPGPYCIQLPGFVIISGNFMTGNPGQYQIAMSLVPHLCISAADSTAGNRQDSITFFFPYGGTVIFIFQLPALSK